MCVKTVKSREKEEPPTICCQVSPEIVVYARALGVRDTIKCNNNVCPQRSFNLEEWRDTCRMM